MKKIVGILAVAAVATSLFAADVAAKVHLEGSLFNFDGKNVKALNIDKPAGQTYNPVYAVSAGDDVAGAKFVAYNNPAVTGASVNEKAEKPADMVKVDTDKYNLTTAEYQIWFKPVENLKMIFGHQDFNLNQEQIGWYRSQSGSAGGQGYGINYSADALSIDVALLPGWGKNWMEKEDGKDLAIAATNLKVQYAADFGTVSALLVAENTFKTLKFGAGYNNNIEGIFFFVNALGFVGNEKFNKVRVEAFAKGNVDALGWAVFVPVDLDVNAKSDAVAVGLTAKGTYQLEACQAYVEINDGNLLAKDFSMSVKPGLTGNVGAASWDVAVDMSISKSFTINVPVVFNFGW